MDAAASPRSTSGDAGAKRPGPPPRFTVVITTHNRPDRLQLALATALVQADDLEVVIVDDGSEPSVSTSISSADPRVRLVRLEPSAGVCAARNAGLAAARGELLCFLDDDDELEPGMLERAEAAISSSALPPPVASAGILQRVSVDGMVFRRNLPPTLPRGSDWFLEPLPAGRSWEVHNTIVAPTEIVRSIGGFDVALRGWEYDDYVLRLNQACSIQGCDEEAYRMIEHHGDRTSARWAEIAEAHDAYRRKHWLSFALHPERIGHFRAAAGTYHLRGGHWGSAVRESGMGFLTDRRARHLAWFVGAILGPLPARRLARIARRRRAG